MRILFDTNVVLDFLLNRKPHASAATRLFALAERGDLEGLLSATSVTTIHYLGAKAIGRDSAGKIVRRVLRLLAVAPVTCLVLDDALALDFADFEDAVQHESGRHADARGIVTHDRAGFRKATLPIYEPDELVKMIRTSGAE